MCIMNKIDVFTIEKFIDRLEKFVKPNLPTDELISYVATIIKDARELIAFGEKKLALDILLENLIEERILIDKEMLALLADIDDEDIQSSVAYLSVLLNKY